MVKRESRQAAQSPRSSRGFGLLAVASFVALALMGTLAAMGLASSSTASTVGSLTNAKFGERVAVDPHGRTLYALSPETTGHLLCKSSECLKFWPALTVRSANAKLVRGAGVHGRLRILRRAHNVFQVTLDGRPLYRYSGDSSKGQANGEDVKTFGGTWHVISAATDTPMQPKMVASPPSSPSPPAPVTPSEKYAY